MDEDDEAVDAPENSNYNIPPSTVFRIVLERKKGYLSKSQLKPNIDNGIDTVSYQRQNEVYKLTNYDRLRMKLLRDD